MRERLVVGVDEAGRGPVLGSMFIGAMAVDTEDMEQLETLRLKDSKKLSDERRRTLDRRIRQVADEIVVREVTASEIDELRKIMSLNEIEMKAFADVIEQLGPGKAILDLPEPDAARFKRKIKNELPDAFEHLKIVAEHKADENYPIVSAASILAKNGREDHIEELKDKYEVNFRSGYPHDEPTIAFLEEYMEQHGRFPDETRTSWNTAKRIKKEYQQKGVTDF
jgi:ribonuclease HII